MKLSKLILLAMYAINVTIYAGQTIPKSKQVYHGKFKNTLLVINFNHPYYNNIPFLQQLYGVFFDQIIFYGEQAHHLVTALPTAKGFNLGPVIEDVLTKYPEYKGYFFVQDDCLLHPWACLSLDLDKLWLPRATLILEQWQHDPWYATANMMDGTHPNAWFWPGPYGYHPAKRGWNQLLAKDRETLDVNVGSHNVPHAQCDLFYIPQRYRKEVLRLNRLFNGVFCEVAVPIIFCCLTNKNEWEHATLYWNFLPELMNSGWPLEFTCLHPVKFSNIGLQSYVQALFDRLILNE